VGVTEGEAPILRLAVGVALGVLVPLGVALSVAVGVVDAVGVGEPVGVGVGVALKETLSETLDVRLGLAPKDRLGVGVAEGEEEREGEPDGVIDGVGVGVCEGDTVADGLEVAAGVLEAAFEALIVVVGDKVALGVSDGGAVALGVADGLAVGARYETVAFEGLAPSCPPTDTTNCRPAPAPGAAVHVSLRWPGALTAQPAAV